MTDLFRQALNRLRAFFRKEPLDSDLDAEMAAHGRVVKGIIIGIDEEYGDEVKAEIGDLVFELLVFLRIDRFAFLIPPWPDSLDRHRDEPT